MRKVLLQTLVALSLLSGWTVGDVGAEARAPRVALIPYGADVTPAVYGEFTDRLGGEEAAPETRFTIATDGLHLFVEIVAAHPEDQSRYRLENYGPDAIHWGMGYEAVEFFIAPWGRHETYYHFALEPGGTSYDNAIGMDATDFDSDWRHEATIGDSAWTARMVIPLAGIGRADGFQPGDRLAFNVTRTTSGPVTHQTWTPTGPRFHHPEVFAEGVIGSFAAAARRDWEALAASAPAAWRNSDAARALEVLADSVRDESSWRAFSAAADAARRTLRETTWATAGLVLWEVAPLGLPGGDELPGPEDAPMEEIVIEAFQAEHVSRAFALAHPGGRPLSQVRVVPGRINEESRQRRRGPVLDQMLVHAGTGARAPVADHLELYAACEIQLAGQVRRDVLRRLRYEDAIAVPREGNGVLWLQVNTTGLAPGEWTIPLDVRVLAEQKTARQVPLTLRVLPAEVPQGPRPYAQAWVADPYRPEHPRGFYGGRAPFVHEQECYLRMLRAFQINTPQIYFPYLNFNSVEYDAEGRAIKGPDLSALEPWIADFGPEALYVLQVRYGHHWPRRLGGGAGLSEPRPPSPVERENFAYFIGQVRRFFEERGVTVENFVWYIEDEVKEGEKQTNVIAAGKLFLEADPEQRRLVTIYSRTEPGVAEAIAPYVNLWVPKLNMRADQEEVLARARATGTNRFSSYMVYARNIPPFSIRAMGAEAFRRGYEGLGLWSFGALAIHYGTSLWNDDPAVNKYALLYEGQDGPVYSVRLMAWRMAIQDYRLLEWATRLADGAPETEAAARVRKIADRMQSASWSRPRPGTLDAAVAELRPWIVRLHAAGASAAAAVQ